MSNSSPSRSEPSRSEPSRSEPSRSGHSEAGLLSTELALLMPVLVLFCLIAVFAVQVQRHSTRARSAADAAARTAALYGSPTAEMDEAARLAAQGECLGRVSAFEIDWVAPDERRLRPGSVSVELLCTERYGGIAALVGSDERTVRSRSVSVIEYWRSP